MKSPFALAAFLVLSMYSNCQHISDTTVTIKANSRIEIDIPKNQMWEPVKEPCVKSIYPMHQKLVLTSECNEPHKVVIKREALLDTPDEPLLDVPKPKGK